MALHIQRPSQNVLNSPVKWVPSSLPDRKNAEVQLLAQVPQHVCGRAKIQTQAIGPHTGVQHLSPQPGYELCNALSWE